MSAVHAGRSGDLVELWPHLSDDELRNVFDAALRMATAMDNDWSRSLTLATLARLPARAESKLLMKALLEFVGNVARQDALESARRAVELTHHFCGSSAVREIGRAINDVCRWYP